MMSCRVLPSVKIKERGSGREFKSLKPLLIKNVNFKMHTTKCLKTCLLQLIFMIFICNGRGHYSLKQIKTGYKINSEVIHNNY